MGPKPRLHGDPPMLSQAEAARVCKVSTATIRRARQAGKLPGAMQTANGWAIPIPELIAAGLMDRTTRPNTVTPRVAQTPKTSPSDMGTTPPMQPADIEELRAKLAAAEQRAAVAEAVARERGLALEDARLALRALTGPVPDMARAIPSAMDMAFPQELTVPPPSQKTTTLITSVPSTADFGAQQSSQPTSTSEASTVQPQGRSQSERRRWWQRAR